MIHTYSSDEALVKAIQSGNEQALAVMIARFTPYVGTVVWNIVKDSMTISDAEEIIADVFVSFWNAKETMIVQNLKGYLGKVARNKAIDALRRFKPELPLEDNALSFPSPNPEQLLTQEEQAIWIQRTLNELPEPDRSIFIRHYYLCQSTGTIASAMSMNINTVQSKLKRGRIKLRTILQEGGYEIEL